MASTISGADAETQTLDVVRELLVELGSEQAARTATAASSLEAELGLGSLERVELLVRIERRLGVRIPDDTARTAETPADWAQAALAGPRGRDAGGRYEVVQPGDAAAPFEDAVSFTDVLRRRAESDPDRVQVHLLEQDEGHPIRYSELYRRASEVAAGLVSAGLERNQTVAIMLPTGEDFFSAFLGVMLAGGIAVPIYPPARAKQIEEYVKRQTRILRNAEVRFLISWGRVQAVARIMRAGLPSLSEATTVADLAARGRASGVHAEREPGDAFFIQYTSGSTGDPKGVTLTHANVLANVRGIGRAVSARPDDIVVSWLPLYHDMGLIGSWLFSLYYAFPITVMSPLDFLARPERWLWALSDSGGTLCPAPNFSYELCARKIPDEALAGVDLSRWRVAINAGEPVLAATLRAFADRFGPVGFRPESYVPCYGLAESSVALTFPPINRAPQIDRIKRTEYETEGRAVPAVADDELSLELVGNGAALHGHETKLVDEQGTEVADRVRGRLIFRGPSKTAGYYRNPKETQAVVDAEGWMDSGDLAYRVDGEIFITGRLKDCIIKSGHNIIPADVELAAADAAGVRRGCVAAFGSRDDNAGTERLIVVAETRASDRRELERIEREVTRLVDERVGLPPDHVRLVPPHAVPKTSSGKIRRIETRELYEEGKLGSGGGAPAWLQLARLYASNVGGWLGLASRRVGRAATKLAAAVLTSTIGGAGGMLLRLSPSRRASAVMIRVLVKLWSALSGRSVRAFAAETPALYLANRSDALDALSVVAALPSPTLLFAKGPLRDIPSALAFLLEPIVLDAETPAVEAVSAALHEGYSVVALSDAPLGSPPERCRFRIEPLQAAARVGAPAFAVRIDGAELRVGAISAVLGDDLDALRRAREAVRAELARLEIADSISEWEPAQQPAA